MLTQTCITVVGGNGFLGQSLLHYFSNMQFLVNIVSRSPAHTSYAGRGNWFVGDAADPILLDQAVEHFGIVLLLAHSVPPRARMLDDSSMKQKLHNIYEVLQAVANVCLRKQARLLYISSGGTVYGDYKTEPYAETDICRPVCMYGASKRLAELEIASQVHDYGLDATIVRLSNPYGPFQVPKAGQGVLAYWFESIAKCNNPQVWGSGSTYRDYIYVDDFCEAVLGIIEKPVHNQLILNIGSGCPTSLRELAEVFQNVCNIRSFDWVDPVHDSLASYSCLSIELAHDCLGWRPTVSLRNGIEATLKWWQGSSRIAK